MISMTFLDCNLPNLQLYLQKQKQVRREKYKTILLKVFDLEVLNEIKQSVTDGQLKEELTSYQKLRKKQKTVAILFLHLLKKFL